MIPYILKTYVAFFIQQHLKKDDKKRYIDYIKLFPNLLYTC